LKPGLAFSGGKDSWACLWLLKEKNELGNVFWVNTGKAYPETLEQVEKAKGLCPEFIEVPVKKVENVYPGDLVPISWTVLGQRMETPKPYAIQDRINCCAMHIAKPLFAAAQAHGVTHIISGQRADEKHRAAYSSGAVVEGFVHLFPLESWTEGDVMRYLETRMEIPEHFYTEPGDLPGKGIREHTSLDCYDCTAFHVETWHNRELLRRKHPNLYTEYLAKRRLVQTAVLSQGW
jgi:phosphoadenosine phosphosulfate reductase